MGMKTTQQTSGGSPSQRMLSRRKSTVQRVAPQVGYLRDLIVNVCFIGEPGTSGDSWILVDAGLPSSAQKIIRAAEQRFGRGTT